MIWDPIFGGSFDREAKKLSSSFRDKRVSYFKDPDSFAGNLWARVLDIKNEREIAWDVYLLYDADAEWEPEPPQPGFWMHQLWGVTKAPRFDVPAFTAKLKDMLEEIKTSNKTEETRNASGGAVSGNSIEHRRDCAGKHERGVSSVNCVSVLNRPNGG